MLRRDLLKLGLAAASLPTLRHLAFAAEGTGHGDTLVVIFQRGGCDGLSLLAPADDPDYVADRAPELRVQTAGAKPGRPLRQDFAPGIDFRLHPEAAPLGDLYEAGHLGFVHAVGLVNGTRSHFVAQDLIDRGIADVSALHSAPEGWLTRLTAGEAPGAVVVSSAPSLPASLAFHADALTIPDLRGGLALPGGAQVVEVLGGLYAQADDPFGRSARAALAEMGRIDTRLPRAPDGKVLPYLPEPGSAYEESEAGRALMTVARLLKMEIGLSVACVDLGGWDHHEQMAGRFASLIGQFSRALVAFWADTARFHDRLSVVVMTEFGRRLRSNKSNGTDHGHGGVMMALGGHVRGGAIYGRWPGLASHQLDNGVDLAVTTDYRRVLAELLAGRHGAASRLPVIFPGFTPGPPLGLV